MHIRLVKKETTVVAEQKLVFHPFLAEGRCVWKDNNKNHPTCYSLKIDPCKKKYRPTQTPIKQMAYAMKESMGDYNNGITHWSNLLDDYDGSAQWCEDKAILDATVNKSKMKKEQRGEYNITVESQNSMAKKYAQLNGLEWSMDNHLEILATMLTDMTGPNAYYLSGDIRLPVKVRKRLGRLKGNDTYKEEYLEALEADAEKTGGTNRTQKLFKETLKVLNEKNEALEEDLRILRNQLGNMQLNHNRDINKLQQGNVACHLKLDKAQKTTVALKKTLEETSEDLFKAIRESKDYVAVGTFLRVKVYEDDPCHIIKQKRANNAQWRGKYRDTNIEHWRSKKESKKRANTTATVLPTSPKRQKVHM